MRRSLVALAASLLAAAIPVVAQAALVWTLVMSPLTATQGQAMVFTLTATNLDVLNRLGCLEVDLSPSFVIQSTGTPVASNGGVWAVNLNGNSVVLNSTTAAGRLQADQTVTFTVAALPTTTGAFLWANHAHNKRDCTGVDQVGAPLAVSVLPAPSPTATPSPTGSPAPTPAPSPAATPTSTPRPTPDDTARPTPASTPDASGNLPVATLGPDGASPTPTPEPSRSSGAPPPSPTGTGAGTALRLAPDDTVGGDDPGGDLGMDLMTKLDGTFVWFVPGAAVGVPGLLVILFVVLQGAGALAWVPAVRRMGGDDLPHQRLGRAPR